MEEKSCDNCVWKENECYGEEPCEEYKERESGDDKDG